MQRQAIVPETAFDWSEIDLSRHSRLTERADGLIDTVRVNAAGLEDVLRQFVRASASVGGLLKHHREPGALVWHLTLEGPDYRASGTVELTLETAVCIAIVARPEGRAPMQYEVLLGRHDDFAGALKRQFRAAAISSVLDAASVVIP